MPTLKLYLLGCLLAAALPFATRPARPAATAHGAFPGWPATFEGRPLQSIALSERDRRFAEGFPGRVAAFGDGPRQILMRWIAAPTRKLHPAAHCFRGAGYAVTHQPLWRDAQGRPWGVITARRGDAVLRVCEQIHDGRGKTWADVSAWYWAAVAGRTSGPWWSVTLIECR